MEILPADPGQAEALSRIAIAAKSHWRYPDSWIARWRDVLTITPAYISTHPTFVAVSDGSVLGFGAVVFDRADPWLDHLWVTPSAMGRGVGRALFRHAEQIAVRAGANRLRIEGDPHAEQFYAKMGATVYDRRDATIDGVQRSLPLLEKRL